MRSTMTRTALAAALAFVWIGCDSSQEPELPDSLDFDAAVVAADGALEDLHMMHGPGLGLADAVFPPLPGAGDCSAVGVTFECRPVDRDGLTYTRTITYLDAGGAALPAYDSDATDAIRYQISVEGEISREWWSASIARQRDLRVTGLLDDNVGEGDGVVSWNGTGSGLVERSRHSDGGAVRTYTIESSSTVGDVVIPYPRAEDGWPLSGTITREMTINCTSDAGSETVTRTVVVTFDGTQFATVTVGDDTFTVDLSERRFAPRKMRDHVGRRFHR